MPQLWSLFKSFRLQALCNLSCSQTWTNSSCLQSITRFKPMTLRHLCQHYEQIQALYKDLESLIYFVRKVLAHSFNQSSSLSLQAPQGPLTAWQRVSSSEIWQAVAFQLLSSSLAVSPKLRSLSQPAHTSLFGWTVSLHCLTRNLLCSTMMAICLFSRKISTLRA